MVEPGKEYHYRNVNIVKNGVLLFREHDNEFKYSDNTTTHFWASSIIIENGGRMTAHSGTYDPYEDHMRWPELVGHYQPYGYRGGILKIHLYGRDDSKGKWDPVAQKFTQQNRGTLCMTKTDATVVGPCGIPRDTWNKNGEEANLPGGRDNFYQYGPLYGDARCTANKDADKDNNWVFYDGNCRDEARNVVDAQVGYFGNKVLAVSYGGSLELAGAKGACHHIDIVRGEFPCYGLRDGDPLRSAPSWTRLQQDLVATRGRVMTEHVLKNVGWGDEIVVTTTDYLPGHSEKFTVVHTEGGVFLTLDSNAEYYHRGTRYGGNHTIEGNKPWNKRLPPRIQDKLDPDLVTNGAETRAAVALLTRSIQILSAGDDDTILFPEETTGYHYGAHMVVRQGFQQVHIQGVEFRQMGQGGRLGHYPVHFHMARKTPKDTHIKDSVVNESMSRWFVLHSTQGVTLARNVGYKSIGHGYYLEDGTETDNKFHSNLGIFARAAIANTQNKRRVPGILSDNQGSNSFSRDDTANPGFPYRSDNEHPTVFWITNGWNDFIGNMAAGTGACGAAFWFVPVVNADHIEVSDNDHIKKPMQWSGYAGLQKMTDPKSTDFAGTTPLKSFYKNYATSTMLSFQTTGDSAPCDGIVAAQEPDTGQPTVKAVESISPKPLRRNKVKPPGTEPDNLNDHYYPHAMGGSRTATRCSGDETKGYDCSKIVKRCTAGSVENCAVTVLDHYTSSFHWAHGNYGAVWLRPQWYLLTNSVISDVQNGGLTFITGGDYTHASVIPGYWALAQSSVFIGNTNPKPDSAFNERYKYVSNAGPFNAISKLKCDQKTDVPSYCLNANEGISMPAGGFFTNQRLANIYDGPSYQDANVFLDIKTADCPVWRTKEDQGCMYGATNSILRLKKTPGKKDDYQKCYEADYGYLPNAAIGWKQPNGFYYPPAFHSRNLFFDNVDLRHYVIDPLFQRNTYLTDEDAFRKQYCSDAGAKFNNWTSIDRQTELTDDDGTLTGLSNNAMPSGTAKETISVNEDEFFNSPTETAECASAVGDNAKPINACAKPAEDQPPATAKTSPQEHVSTVVYHEKVPDNDSWGSDCTSESCYGVPLFRQLLTASEKKTWDKDCGQQSQKQTDACRWPFIRMAGADMQQRQTMTMNNGVYYVDTTVSLGRQQDEKFSQIGAGGRQFNVFAKSQTYYLFFLYARKTTIQTYQIYVGENFMKDDRDKKTYGEYNLGRMNIASAPLNFVADPNLKGITVDRSQVASKGILTVKINFAGVTELDPTPAELCQPRSFCQPSTDKKSCQMALADNDPLLLANRNLKVNVTAACKDWAVKDLDCPKGGCLGLSFTLPSDFATGQYKRPEPDAFPRLVTQFSSPEKPEPGNQCYYDPKNPPVSGPCPDETRTAR